MIINKTIWEVIKECINKHSYGDDITRQELLIYCFDMICRFSSATIDNYRRMLSVCGYISIGNGDGKYKFLKPIPKDLTLSELKNIYNQTSK